MSKEQIREDFKEIFDHIADYALIRVAGGGFIIYHITNRSYVISEQNLQSLIKLLLEENITVANSVEEVNRPGFVRYFMKWDEQKKEFVKTWWDEKEKRFMQE